MSDNDVDWNKLYNIIYNCNVILDEVPNSTGSVDSVKNELMAEAKVHRADAYLTLVNMHAKPYSSSTASTDFGVPLILKPTVSDDLSRASVEAVYNLIVSDLTNAVKYLPKYAAYNILPSQVAAFALLARTNLLMGKYTQAGAWADIALALQNTLNNLSSLTTATYPKRLLDPEIILSKQAYQGFTTVPTAFRLSDSLLSLLGTNDLRYSFFYHTSFYLFRYFIYWSLFL